MNTKVSVLSDMNRTAVRNLINEKDFTAFYEEYKHFVYTAAYGFTQCVYSAEDIQQDVFLRLWNNRHKIEPVENLRPYLFICTRNISFSFLRRRKQERKIVDDEPGRYAHPLREIEARMLYKVVRKQVIDHLPAYRKLVYLMAVENDVPYLEVARLMSVSPSTIKNHRALANRTIKTFLRDVADFADNRN